MTYKELSIMAMKIRLGALELVREIRSGHLGGSLSLAEILAVLYFDKLNIDPANPHWEKRDRLVLSKGHCTPALYTTLCLRGFFPKEDLKQFRRTKGNMSGHAEIHVKGVDMSTGSLGQGLSVALGMAVTAKMYDEDYRVYAICGDGEIQEGQIWEAAMAAPNFGLNNLTLIIDNNHIQLDGRTRDIMNPESIADKFRSFKWNVLEVDGHDTQKLADAVEAAKAWRLGPTVIVADTVKGKGVSFMENNVLYHGHVPEDALFVQAIAEVKESLSSLEK